MIKKIKSSLTAKLFLITTLLLTLVCMLTYGFIALFMPLSYSAQIAQNLESRTQKLIKDLSNVTLDQSASLLISYIIETDTNIVLKNENGDIVETPAGATIYYYYESNNKMLETSTPLEGRTPDAYGIDIFHNTASLSENMIDTAENTGWAPTIDAHTIFDRSYTIHFSENNAIYELTVTFAPQLVNQALEALHKILPWLILAVIGSSMIGSLLYSRYVTRPIIKISSISKKMSALEFNWNCDDNRLDEIGVLACSLNQMSEKLAQSLNELQEANAALKADIEHERQLEQNRLVFFSSVSHELKTPITIIKGQIEGMLGNVGAYSDREKYLKRSLTVTQTLEDMVQDILTISRLESSAFELKKSAVNFTTLLWEAAESYHELIEQRGITLYMDVAENLYVQTEKKLLHKVLVNLLSNAVLYSPLDGHILIKASKKDKKVTFQIENTATWIPDEALPKVYNAFFRVEKSRSRKTGGTGLGLYFVKMILDMHDAKYNLYNTASGVKFLFEIE